MEWKVWRTEKDEWKSEEVVSYLDECDKVCSEKQNSLNLQSLISIDFEKNKHTVSSSSERHLGTRTPVPVWLLIKTDGYISLEVYKASLGE